MSRSEPTNLSLVPMPLACRDWVLEADVAAVIHDQRVEVNLTWWNSAIEAVGGGPVQGTVDDEVSAARKWTISRGDLFKLAPAAAVMTATWSAPARSRSRTSSTVRMPPPTVIGTNTSCAALRTISVSLLLPYKLATISM